MDGPSPGVISEQKPEKSEGERQGKGYREGPSRQREGWVQISEAGKFEEKQGSHCALTVGEAGGVQDEAGEMGWSHVEGAL